MLGAQSRGRSRSWDVSEAETRLAAARERQGTPGGGGGAQVSRQAWASEATRRERWEEVLPSRRVGSAAPSSHRAGGPERRAHLILLGVPSSMAESSALVGGLIPHAPQTAQDSVL